MPDETPSKKPTMIGKRAANKPNKKGAPERPFVSCRPTASALGELERAPGFGAAIFLALDHARVAGQESTALQHAAQVGLVGGERLEDAVAHRTGLAREPAARHRADDVVLTVAVRRDQRLLDQHSGHRAGETDTDRRAVYTRSA